MSFVDNWDSSQPNAFWDVGLEFDVNQGPPTGNVAPYTNLITSEHQNLPKFMATVALLCQPFADMLVLLQGMSSLYDLDAAVGAQLDVLGKWVGVSRYVAVPLQSVYFSFDTTGLGFDQGTIWEPGDPLTQLDILPDAAYLTLLKAKIANNNWDGTTPGAYDIWNTLFAGTGIGILIEDYQNMHILYALTGPVPDAVTLALFEGGYLNVKTAGVRIDAYMTPTVPNTPYFGFDVSNAAIAGFDVGQIGKISPGS